MAIVTSTGTQMPDPRIPSLAANTAKCEIVDVREFMQNPVHGEPPIDVTNIDSGLPKVEVPPMTLEERVEALERRVAELEDEVRGDYSDW